MFKFTYDAEAKAIYIYLMEGDYKLKQEALVDDCVILDKTELGQIYGIEILNVEPLRRNDG